MGGDFGIWDGGEWEGHVLHLLQAEHGAHNVQKVPAKHLGDSGLDFICLYKRLVYQCYAVQEPIDVASRADKQKTKITTDIGKFCDPSGGAAAILKNEKIKRWILAVPLHDSKAVVEHAATKAAEVRAKKLPYVDDDFQIIIQDQETFDADTWNYRMLLRKRIRPVVPEPTDNDVAAISDGDQTLAVNLRTKMVKRVPDPSELEDVVDDLLRVFLHSENTKDALRFMAPDAYEDVVRLISERLRRLRLGSRRLVGDPLDAEIDSLKTAILSAVPNLDPGTADTIALGAVSDWLMRCPLRLD
ncbi:hypothetical protein NS226_08140 [Aureimonas ureilytica]|uniref:Uncharacterized protein n=1 Tax=Aureimonas ureilytica TaxID=401562 RepID=A0A175RAQ8_9HYPH|nr:hypothetical protein [Aureimonas ureilytica]KTQ96330.1 hypothetical protein NS226_08140 [Aureimonas ureilytica]